MEETGSDLTRRLAGLNPFSLSGIVHWIDILLVTFLLFRVIKLIRGRQAWRVVWGVVTFLLALYLSDRLGLTTVHYVLDKVAVLAPVALAILFLPELRQAIEGFARLGLWSERLLMFESGPTSSPIDEIVAAVAAMSERHVGALIVLERQAVLEDVVATGVRLDAQVSAALLEAIFYGENPLHDGAVVIRNDKIVAAACRLPLSESATVARHMHMRHRAGLGVTEHSDCVVVVVSEERGTYSVAIDGRMKSMQDMTELREELRHVLGLVKPVPHRPAARVRRNGK